MNKFYFNILNEHKATPIKYHTTAAYNLFFLKQFFLLSPYSYTPNVFMFKQKKMFFSPSISFKKISFFFLRHFITKNFYLKTKNSCLQIHFFCYSID